MIINSHLKLEDSKCKTSINFYFVTVLCQIAKFLFRVTRNLLNLLISNSKFCCLEIIRYYIDMFNFFNFLIFY